MKIAAPAPLRKFKRFVDVQTACRRLLSNTDLLTPKQRDLVNGVAKIVSLDDEMYGRRPEHYFQVGLSAIENINDVLAAAGVGRSIKRILDFPCGHGRVLRYLRQQFPAAEIYAGVIDTGAVAFCEEAFGAIGIKSDTDFRKVALDRKFDLIWCGSLITHLQEEPTLQLFEFLSSHVDRRGVLVITTHGSFATQLMVQKSHKYGLTEEAARSIAAAYAATGYGYAHYPGRTDYGIAAVSPDWIRAYFRRKEGWKEIYCKEHGWDDHQDVIAFARQD